MDAVLKDPGFKRFWDEWSKPNKKEEWGAVVTGLLHMALSLMSGEPRLTEEQCQQNLEMLDELGDLLADTQRAFQDRAAVSRSADGIMQVDQGVFNMFEGCKPTTIEEALQDVDLEQEANELGMNYWFCNICSRPTSESYSSHMRLRHPLIIQSKNAEQNTKPLNMEDVLGVVRRRKSKAPACTVYSMETPVYLASNKAMREWDSAPVDFLDWRKFAFLLDSELRRLDRFKGNAYRAVDFRVPPKLYRVGNIVTWNQPSSASEDPRVAKGFLRRAGVGLPVGTIFIIQSITARQVSAHSVYPKEKEVLFLAGTQFQVLCLLRMAIIFEPILGHFAEQCPRTTTGGLCQPPRRGGGVGSRFAGIVYNTQWRGDLQGGPVLRQLVSSPSSSSTRSITHPQGAPGGWGGSVSNRQVRYCNPPAKSLPARFRIPYGLCRHRTGFRGPPKSTGSGAGTWDYQVVHCHRWARIRQLNNGAVTQSHELNGGSMQCSELSFFQDNYRQGHRGFLTHHRLLRTTVIAFRLLFL